ncbi:hypothetical protein [Phenylobacterium sp.]|jgi:hypothetical protein|uniref:hypothetical protein n=1 Tax=Phenylobacterium sp. TaxID=1871053 RepID=UPI002E36E44E|nr:hypothetical protein [Phenylobacterium sp.]HEX4711829.1 hypothetical protein [Phenylobacterium sp.]
MTLLAVLIVGLGLVIAAGALLVAASRAELRARRSLYRALGIGEEAVDLLIARNGDVLSELSLLRPPEAADPAPDGEEAASAIAPLRPEAAARPVRQGEARLPPTARRQPYASRDRRV